MCLKPLKMKVRGSFETSGATYDTASHPRTSDSLRSLTGNMKFNGSGYANCPLYCATPELSVPAGAERLQYAVTPSSIPHCSIPRVRDTTQEFVSIYIICAAQFISVCVVSIHILYLHDVSIRILYLRDVLIRILYLRDVFIRILYLRDVSVHILYLRDVSIYILYLRGVSIHILYLLDVSIHILYLRDVSIHSSIRLAPFSHHLQSGKRRYISRDRLKPDSNRRQNIIESSQNRL